MFYIYYLSFYNKEELSRLSHWLIHLFSIRTLGILVYPMGDNPLMSLFMLMFILSPILKPAFLTSVPYYIPFYQIFFSLPAGSCPSLTAFLNPLLIFWQAGRLMPVLIQIMCKLWANSLQVKTWQTLLWVKYLSFRHWF